MITRIITAIVLLIALIPVLVFSNTWVFPIALALCSGIAELEMLKCMKLNKKISLLIPTVLYSVLVPFFVRFFDDVLVYLAVVFAAFLCMSLYCLTISVFSKGKIPFDSISTAGFLTLYITLGFSAIIMLRDFFTLGNYMYLLVFVGAWVTDTFAYFCGMLFGKHKLIPEISPKKTVEGSIGGTIFAGIGFVVFGIVVNSINRGDQTSYIKLFVYGIIAALVAQIGDLCMSAMKRQHNIKDFGKLFPGHGGILDRFDSIIAVSLGLFILEIFNYIF